MLKKEKINVGRFYELEGKRVAMFSDYSKKQIIYETKRYLFFLDIIKKCNLYSKKNISILDLGCGDGHFIRMLQNEGFKNIYGLDISTTRIARARQMTGLGPKKIKKSLAEKASFGDNYFDLIICSEVIEHIEKPKDILLEIKRLLKKGGIFILSTPNEEKINYSRCVHCSQMTSRSGHLHSFSLESLKLMIKSHNLHYVNSYYLISNIKPFNALNALISKMPFSIFIIFNRLITIRESKRNWLIIIGNK